uniref:MAP7 domain-containing protein 3-like n=1 Tax=Jaculus jaculus TaxID=51337 RepID=UPI001E1B4EA4|nr:MAP7 domain-containing protein 3-like [Jaculus jaculus]
MEGVTGHVFRSVSVPVFTDDELKASVMFHKPTVKRLVPAKLEITEPKTVETPLKKDVAVQTNVNMNVPPKVENSKMDMYTSTPSAKKQPQSSISCYTWLSSISAGWHPPSSMKNVTKIEKNQPPSALPDTSKLSPQISLPYKIKTIHDFVHVPNVEDIVKKMNEKLSKVKENQTLRPTHMTGKESDKKIMPKAMTLLLARPHPPYEQKDKEEKKDCQKEKNTSNEEAVREKPIEGRTKEFPTCKHELLGQDLTTTSGCVKPEELEQQSSETSEKDISKEEEIDNEDKTESREDSSNDIFASDIKTSSIKHKTSSITAMGQPQELVLVQAKTGEVDKEKKIYFNDNVKVDRQNDPTAEGSRFTSSNRTIDIDQDIATPAGMTTPNNSNQHEVKATITSFQGPEVPSVHKKQSNPTAPLSNTCPQRCSIPKTADINTFTASRSDFGRQEEEDQRVTRHVFHPISVPVFTDDELKASMMFHKPKVKRLFPTKLAMTPPKTVEITEASSEPNDKTTPDVNGDTTFQNSKMDKLTSTLMAKKEPQSDISRYICLSSISAGWHSPSPIKNITEIEKRQLPSALPDTLKLSHQISLPYKVKTIHDFVHVPNVEDIVKKMNEKLSNVKENQALSPTHMTGKKYDKKIMPKAMKFLLARPHPPYEQKDKEEKKDCQKEKKPSNEDAMTEKSIEGQTKEFPTYKHELLGKYRTKTGDWEQPEDLEQQFEVPDFHMYENKNKMLSFVCLSYDGVTRHVFRPVSVPVFTDDELKASMMFYKPRVKMLAPTKLEITEPKNVETSLKKDVAVQTNVNMNVPPKVDVKVLSPSNVQVPSEGNIEDTSEVSIQVFPKVNIEVPTEVNIKGYSMSPNNKLSPIASMDFSPSTNVGSSSLVRVNISPIVSIDTSSNTNKDPSLDSIKESKIMEELPVRNIGTYPASMMEASVEPNDKTTPDVNGDMTLQNSEMDKHNSILTAKKQPQSNISCCRWLSSTSTGWRLPSPVKNITEIQKSQPQLALPGTSKLPTQISVPYKRKTLQDILYVPNVEDVAKKMKEILSKVKENQTLSPTHMANKEYDKKIMPKAMKSTETSEKDISKEDEPDNEDRTKSHEDSFNDIFISDIKTSSTKRKSCSATAMRQPQQLVLMQAKTGEVDTEKKIYFNGNVKVDRQNGPTVEASRKSTEKKYTRTMRNRKTKGANNTVQYTESDSAVQWWSSSRISDSDQDIRPPAAINTPNNSSKHEVKSIVTSLQGPEEPSDQKKQSNPTAPLSKTCPQRCSIPKPSDINALTASRSDFGRQEEGDQN